MTSRVGMRSGLWSGFTFGLGLLAVLILAGGAFLAAGGIKVVAKVLHAVQAEQGRIELDRRLEHDRWWKAKQAFEAHCAIPDNQRGSDWVQKYHELQQAFHPGSTSALPR